MKKLLLLLCFLSLFVGAQPLPPPSASQAEVNAGTLKNKFVSPLTLLHWTGVPATTNSAQIIAGAAVIVETNSPGQVYTLSSPAVTNLVPGRFTTLVTNGGTYTIGSSDTNLTVQELWPSLNAFGDSIVSGEAGLPGWVYTLKTNLDDATEVLNFGGSGYQQYNVASTFLASGHTNEPYFMEIAYNGYTGDPVADASNRLYFLNVATTNTPRPWRFMILQMPNDMSSSNSTARYSFTTNVNAQVSALYPTNYYPWWDWLRAQTNGSAQGDSDYTAGIPPAYLMNSDGIHPNAAGNARLGTNMAGIWRSYNRSNQHPVLTADMAKLFRGLTNVDLQVKNLGVGSGAFYDRAVFEQGAGNIRMASPDGSITWTGTNNHGGLSFYEPGLYATMLAINPTNGYLQFVHSSLTNPTVDVIIDTGGGITAKSLVATPDILLGLTTAATAHSLNSIAYGDQIAAMYLGTYSADNVVLYPRVVITTSLGGSGNPGVARVIVTNSDLAITSGRSIYGDASGVSNAVTLIASGCIQINTNGDGHTWTFGLAGSGSDVVTNYRTAAISLTNSANQFSGTFTNPSLASKLTFHDANGKEIVTTASGAVPINADSTATTVAQLMVAITTNTATAADVLTATSATSAKWAAPSGGSSGDYVVRSGTNMTGSLTITNDATGNWDLLSAGTINIYASNNTAIAPSGLALSNVVVSTSGNQRWSPSLGLWGSGFTSSAIPVGFIMDTEPTSGTAGNLTISNVVGTTATRVLQLSSASLLSVTSLSIGGGNGSWSSVGTIVANNVNVQGFVALGGSSSQFAAPGDGNYVLKNSLASQIGTLQWNVTNVTKTANYTVVALDAGKYFNNIGASGAITNTLPTAVAGMRFSFYVDAAQILAVQASGSDTIRYRGTVSAAAGNIFSNVQGAYLDIFAVASGKWIVNNISVPLLAVTTDWTGPQ